MDALENSINQFFSFSGEFASWPGLLIVTVLKIVIILIPVILSVAYLTYAERKVIGAIQLRVGPNRVGYYGLLQPIADVIKLILKEVIKPTEATTFLFFIASNCFANRSINCLVGNSLCTWFGTCRY